MNVLYISIDKNLTTALGWTIMHSLWQGLIIGLIVFLIFRLGKEKTPQFKYFMALMGLLAIAGTSLITFVLEYDSMTGLSRQMPENFMQSGLEEHLGITGNKIPVWHQKGQIGILAQSISSSFQWLTSIWIFGVILFSVRLSGGLIMVNRLSRRGLSPLPFSLEDRLKNFAVKSGMKRALQIFQSNNVVVPMVIGILRPIILIPAGIISLMPIEQMEAIIAHEIAHIRRYDFLVNIIQSLVEALFFYHPFVWILSERVRQEREKCCDDFALGISGKLSTYAMALKGLIEFQDRPFIPSMALSGKRNRISIRVERLINQKKMKTNASEKILAGLLILVSAGVLSISTGASLSSKDYQQHGNFLQLNLHSPERIPTQIAGQLEPLSISEIPDVISPPALPIYTSDVSDPGQPTVASIAAVSSISSSRPGRIIAADTIRKRENTKIDVKDNLVTREFVNKEGKEQKITFLIRKGKVEKLTVNGTDIPESDFPQYQKEIDRTLSDLKEMDHDLREARVNLEDVDFDEISRKIAADLEKFRQEDMQKIQDDMKNLQMEQIRKQLEKAREEAMRAMKDIDFEKIEQEVQRAMAQIEKIDVEEIQRKMQESMKNLEHERIHMDQQKLKMDELIKELEKLELE